METVKISKLMGVLRKAMSEFGDIPVMIQHSEMQPIVCLAVVEQSGVMLEVSADGTKATPVNHKVVMLQSPLGQAVIQANDAEGKAEAMIKKVAGKSK